jgi:hypothetical protein
LIAGSLASVILSLGTDIGLHAIGVFPALGQPVFDDRLLLLATAYRTLYGVLSSYITARLAPDRPMQHALLGGAVGLVLNIAVVATWNKGLGPHWYPLALAALTMPIAWIGGALRVMQLRTQTAVQ